LIFLLLFYVIFINNIDKKKKKMCLEILIYKAVEVSIIRLDHR